ncbi:hypothetical protein B0T24DRAFT_641825 [Lasiosphaeria ovina]|uniref:Uncharacterized protein n=1 Tax=Lasiosphaeria ovina TaxID=92902 RepID=A0AAE0JU09_9PEZI|nr:hypothetical protein B0T24DRAFT_641825 [Lasiosphaeria ovina]
MHLTLMPLIWGLPLFFRRESSWCCVLRRWLTGVHTHDVAPCFIFALRVRLLLGISGADVSVVVVDLGEGVICKHWGYVFLSPPCGVPRPFLLAD